jgi:hypothetical protein
MGRAGVYLAHKAKAEGNRPRCFILFFLSFFLHFFSISISFKFSNLYSKFKFKLQLSKCQN